MTTAEHSALSQIVYDAVCGVIENGTIEKELVTRKGSFRRAPSKTAHELTKYVHRMMTFHSGINPSMPCTADFHVMNFADEVLGQKNKKLFDKNRYSMVIRTEDVKAIYKVLDDYADSMCKKFGLPTMRAARMWANVMGW